MSRVDVVVPCYRYGHYLRGCVGSVLAQRGVDVRVLIVDDCSPDRTPETAAQLIAEDGRVEYRRHTVNRGHIASYNEGIEWATGAYFLLLSADDMAPPGALRRAAGVMDAHPDVVLTYGREIRSADFSVATALPDGPDGSCEVMPGDEFWRRSSLEAANIVPTPSAVVRTAAQKDVGAYRPTLPHSGDLEMWLRLATRGAVARIDAVQGLYRTHGQNMSVAFVGLGDLKQKKAAFDSAAADAAGRLSDTSAAMALAYQAIAKEAFWAGSGLFDRGQAEPCEECHAFARSLWPAIDRWGPWRRFQVKRMAGPMVWKACRPVLHWAKRSCARLRPSVAR